jgi:hypothetical protein
LVAESSTESTDKLSRPTTQYTRANGENFKKCIVLADNAKMESLHAWCHGGGTLPVWIFQIKSSGAFIAMSSRTQRRLVKKQKKEEDSVVEVKGLVKNQLEALFSYHLTRLLWQ